MILPELIGEKDKSGRAEIHKKLEGDETRIHRDHLPSGYPAIAPARAGATSLRNNALPPRWQLVSGRGASPVSFNNMLSVILGYAQMGFEKTDPTSSLYGDLQEIHNAGVRSANITRQQTIAPQILDLNETVESMLKMLRRLIGEDIKLNWLPGPSLLPVMIDPSQVDQILANLCVNARDAIIGVGKITIETTLAICDLCGDFLRVYRNWLVEHIQECDHKYAPYLRVQKNPDKPTGRDPL